MTKKSVSCSTLIGCLTSSISFIFFFSTYSSSSEIVIITNVGVGGEKCLWKPHNVSLGPSPTIVIACLNASKISCSMSLLSLKLSLHFQNIGGSLDVSDLM